MTNVTTTILAIDSTGGAGSRLLATRRVEGSAAPGAGRRLAAGRNPVVALPDRPAVDLHLNVVITRGDDGWRIAFYEASRLDLQAS